MSAACAGQFERPAVGVHQRVALAALDLLAAIAHAMYQRLLASDHASIAAFAAAEGVTGSYISRLIRLAWLAPDITQAIVRGQQPLSLTTMQLIAGHPLPMEWPAQRTLLGFG